MKLRDFLDEKVDSKFAKTMLQHYLVALLWATSGTTPEGEELEGLDSEYDVSDIEKGSVKKSEKDVAKFIKLAGDILTDLDPEQVGHDLFLTRNGHGAGFWDRDYEGKDALEDITKKNFDEVYPYVGDDNKVYID